MVATGDSEIVVVVVLQKLWQVDELWNEFLMTSAMLVELADTQEAGILWNRRSARSKCPP